MCLAPYDAVRSELHVADGTLSGVTPDVWAFEVSGLVVLPRWLGWRMVKPAGKAGSSKSPLDKIRPTTWSAEWTNELLEVVAVLRETLALQPRGIGLLDEIVAGPLIPADSLPPVPVELRQPPQAGRSSSQDEAFVFEDGMLPGTHGEVIF